MPSTDTKYLKLRGNVWHYQRRIPKDLLDQFDGETTISESLGTGDIRDARLQRDIINGKLQERKFNAPNKNRHRFLELVQSMAERKKNDPEYWDEPYDIDEVLKTGKDPLLSDNEQQENSGEIFINAYTTVSEYKNQSHKYRITLKEALTNWSRQKRKAISADSKLKANKSVDEFLKSLKLYDIQLEDISKRQVYNYIGLLMSKHATSTARSYISRLRSIWNYCEQLSEVTTACPFDGHSFAGGTEKQKKLPFNEQEVRQIRVLMADEEPIRQLLVKLAVFTGCRISELCNLQARHVEYKQGVHAIFIEKGKTDAATRIVPLTDELGQRLRAIAETKGGNELLLGLDGKKMSRWFSRIKTAHISTDSAKTFHSFRKMFTTAMQRSGVLEADAAPILGHSRGNCMTYGYYSDGYTLPQLKAFYDQGIAHIIW
ncbi:tyrosine-type recombinase/integrase [Colwellia psychrerythraea]|uniref:Integrase family protein n=1 Tax=Colwellia psychrerythraea TaxID=28229 RepID=A0A099KTX3_COLPS|nr:tyrosine-type recombinase/integrase [Colwellia psychrerythraea]KGJ93327.1 integrase family protein [Colwellia psychrerythraea]